MDRNIRLNVCKWKYFVLFDVLHVHDLNILELTFYARFQNGYEVWAGVIVISLFHEIYFHTSVLPIVLFNFDVNITFNAGFVTIGLLKWFNDDRMKDSYCLPYISYASKTCNSVMLFDNIYIFIYLLC